MVLSKEEDYVPSNDEEGDVLPPDAETVNNLVQAHGLSETFFDKKSFTSYIKVYLQKVKAYLEEKNPERVKPFMTGMLYFFKWSITFINLNK